LKPTSQTQIYAVIGDPIAHSLSPLIHNLWIEQAGLDAVYFALNLKTQTAEADIRALGRSGFSGLNVTLPHKLAALKAASRQTAIAAKIGAANTLSNDGNGDWGADNTDGTGFETLLKSAAGPDISGKRIILIGAGGAARAAAVSMSANGADLAIVNRTISKAQTLAEEVAPNAEIAEMTDLERLSKEADIMINSASLGHSNGQLPELAEGKSRPFIDLSYGKAADIVLAGASEAGWATHDGLPMLVGQAAEAFNIWFHKRPDQAAALQACRAHLEKTS
jgi:shikimate dehydrogenase